MRDSHKDGMDQDRFIELSWTLLLWRLEEPDLGDWQAELDRRGEQGQAELARMREALASLAFATPPVTPPAALRQRLLDEVARGGATQAGAGATGAGASETGAADAGTKLVADARPGLGQTIIGGQPPSAPASPSRGAGRFEAEVIPINRPARPWIAAASAAAALALLLGLWNVRLRDELNRTRGEIAVLQPKAAAVDTAAAELASLGRRAAAADSLAAQLEQARRDLAALVAPRGSAHQLVGTVNQPGASARIFIDPATGRVLLFVYELPVLPRNSVYELWAIKGGTPTPAGTFVPTDQRQARIELPDGRVLEGADTLAVTVEPAPGVAAPTGTMVLISS
ncbi:MAG: anti-sigma factor [Gemmatimonadetes bacterium]|nr:anti-sigma factor [Gemmatimonadota bacterium]